MNGAKSGPAVRYFWGEAIRQRRAGYSLPVHATRWLIITVDG